MTDTTLVLAERIFLTVFPILIIVVIGYLYGRFRPADIEFANRANMDLFVPALIFHSLSSQNVDLGAYQSLAFGAALVLLGSGLLCWPLCRWLKVDHRTFLPPMMFNNSGNLGLPLFILAFGEEVLAAAVILFIIENTLHMSLGVYMVNPRAQILRVLMMPMMLATYAGLLWAVLQWPVSRALAVPIEMLGQIAIPLMLFTLGIRIATVDLSNWRIGVIGALLRPLTGLLIALLCQLWLQLPPLQFSMLLIFSVLPPAVLNYMVAERYNQQPDQVASIVLIGNIAALFVMPLVLFFAL